MYVKLFPPFTPDARLPDPFQDGTLYTISKAALFRQHSGRFRLHCALRCAYPLVALHIVSAMPGAKRTEH
jgi:hypothetical protein